MQYRVDSSILAQSIINTHRLILNPERQDNAQETFMSFFKDHTNINAQNKTTLSNDTSQM